MEIQRLKDELNNVSNLINTGLASVNAAMAKVNSLCDATCLRNLMLQYLDRQYKIAEYTYDNAPLNMYIAQQNYV